MKILYVGESWNGSSARSLREALADLPDVSLDDIGEDHYLPRYRPLLLRAANRLLRWVQIAELESEIKTRLRETEPDLLMVYKGAGVSASLVREVKQAGVLTVNVFPDCSPHAHGSALREAIGEYDLVLSTKPFHPDKWRSFYGYENLCVFVPHGYDPRVHYWPNEPGAQDLDVVLAAMWRPEYDRLLRALSDGLQHMGLRTGIAGDRWPATRLPTGVEYFGPLHGRAYGEWLRRGRIALAPVNTVLSVGGRAYPGDQDTTRTYELAAAHCFFLHRRTKYVQTVYDERAEVPMWDAADELIDHVRYFLAHETERKTMARAAHTRAVPAYSIQERAAQIRDHLKSVLSERSVQQA